MDDEQEGVHVYCKGLGPERNFAETIEWKGMIYCVEEECTNECCKIRKVVEQT